MSKNILYINPFNDMPLKPDSNGLRDQVGNNFTQKSGAWRFVKEDNYTDNFGFQWNKFEKTQIDRYRNGLVQSKNRLFAVTGWDKEDLTDSNILEVGSGAGRFTQVVLKYTKANIYSVDYSSAVEANFRNNGPDDRLHLFQANLYELPFQPGQFDKVFCFGVLQHTPDFEQSVKSLIDMVKPGGELVVDFYPIKGWFTKIHAKYMFRPITKRMKPERLLDLITRTTPVFIKLYKFFDHLGLSGIINRFLPICDIKNTLPENLDDKQLDEWVILDTFDMFSPVYDNPQKIVRVKKWFENNGMEVTWADFIRFDNNKVAVVKGIKKK